MAHTEITLLSIGEICGDMALHDLPGVVRQDSLKLYLWQNENQTNEDTALIAGHCHLRMHLEGNMTRQLLQCREL